MTPAMVTRTKPGTRRLSEVARHVVKPSGITATGWGPVERICREKLGVTFDEWQAGAGRIILARREDGKLAATVGGVGMSLPRQVGKTYLLAGLIFGLCIHRPGMLVIWSAHHARTHGETFLSMQAFADRSKVRPYVRQVFTGSGDEEIRFQNGSRILFGARERGFGRGIPGVDVLVMDEAQILSDKALENMLATLNTSDFGLQLYVGTPPRPEDNSEAFTRMRSEALSEAPDDLAWIECGADAGADPDDRKQWAKANPSYPHRTPVESIQRLRSKLTPDGFLHEALGVWDDQTARALIMPNWPMCATTNAAPTPAALGLAVDEDRVWISLAASSAGDRPHLGSIQRVRLGTHRAHMVSEVARIQSATGADVVLDRKGPASTLEDDLLAAGVRVTWAGLDDYVTACADLFDAVESGQVEHGDYDDLNDAVAAAAKRKIGERWAWSRRNGDVSMLEAVTLARWGAVSVDPSPFNIW